ncbi:MAG: AAA family ATPase [Patulibacter sp.]|nr:AAA family ATPase [Patulibacter sp.]
MSTDLLEREAPIAALDRALDGACAGDGSVRLLVGPAGIGKTAVLDVVRGRASDRGALVLGARASELDRGFGFGIVHQLLETTVRSADPERRDRLLAGAAVRAGALFGRTAPDGDAEYGVLSGLYWLLANLAEERPVVLCVDDLQWADVASLRWLEFVARRVDGLSLLVVATIRRHEPGAPAALLLALEDAAERVELAPLSDFAVGRVLARALGDDPDDDFRDAARKATGGNPLLLSLLAREAAGQGLRGRADERGRLPELGGRGLAPVIVRRLGTLGVAATAVARAAAIVGERAPVEDLVALADRDGDTVRGALGALADAQILDPGGWTYVHPLVREAVRASIPHAERERLHRFAATRMRERGARPAEIALHWLATTPTGDAVATGDLRAAAGEAATEGATSTAVDLLRRALDEQAADDQATRSDRASLLLDLAELELWTLLPEGRERARDALAAGLQGQDAARAHAALGTVLLLTDPVAALAEIDAALARATDRGLRLRLEASSLEVLAFVDALAPTRIARYQEIRQSPDPSVVELAHLASEEALVGRPADEVTALGVRATTDDALLNEVGPGGPTWNLLGHAFRFAEQPELARRVLSEGDRVIRERGLRAAGVFMDQSWAYWHRDFGSVAQGLAHARAGYDSIADADLPISTTAVAMIVAENLVLLDRVAEADELMDQPFGPAEGTFVEVFALTARGLTRTLVGRHDEAERDLRRVVEIVDERGWRAPAAARGRMRLAELLVARGRADEARGLIDHDVAAAESAGTRGALGAALRVRATTEDGASRLETLRRAEASLASSPLRLEHGRTLLDLGVTLRAHGERTAARDVLRNALDIASRTESAWLARQVRDELQASGARPRRERISGVAALTASERRTAELAAEGLSNREIAEALWVTRKTVEYHLSRVYAKLGIASRSALPDALSARAAV